MPRKLEGPGDVWRCEVCGWVNINHREECTSCSALGDAPHWAMNSKPLNMTRVAMAATSGKLVVDIDKVKTIEGGF